MEDLKNVLSNRMNLLMIMICIVFCFQLVNLFKSSDEVAKVNYIKKEIKSLKDDIDNIYKSEKALDKKIDTFNFQIKNVHRAITINNSKIDNLKKNEKIQIDKFKFYNDARMWEKYFTERYSKKNLPTTNNTTK